LLILVSLVFLKGGGFLLSYICGNCGHRHFTRFVACFICGAVPLFYFPVPRGVVSIKTCLRRFERRYKRELKRLESLRENNCVDC